MQGLLCIVFIHLDRGINSTRTSKCNAAHVPRAGRNVGYCPGFCLRLRHSVDPLNLLSPLLPSVKGLLYRTIAALFLSV